MSMFSVRTTLTATAAALIGALVAALLIVTWPHGRETGRAGTLISMLPSGARTDVLQLTNAVRARHDCPPVKPQKQLRKVSQEHADDMAVRNFFSHDTRGGKNWDERVRASGYKGNTVGENIAYGQITAAEVVDDWMDSPGHRRNILTCTFKHMGVGYSRNDDGVPYWVQDFGGD